MFTLSERECQSHTSPLFHFLFLHLRHAFSGEVQPLSHNQHSVLRFTVRDWVERKLADAPRARALDRAVTRQSFRLVLLLRLSPVFPYNVLNYALGLTDVSIGRYVAASFLGMLPGTWLYVYLGSLATAAADLGASGRVHSSATVALWAIGLGATLAVVYFVTRVAKAALQKELE